MKKIISLVILSSLFITINAQKPEDTEDWSRKPVVVTPGKGTLPPSDAIVLYSGASDADKWEHNDGTPITIFNNNLEARQKQSLV